jgi:hypothetical protein
MKVARVVPVLFAIGSIGAITACKGPSKEDLQVARIAGAESLSVIRSELLDQMMEGTRFVNEINAELAKARSVALAPKQLEPAAEVLDVTGERRRVVERITQLVTRLDNVSFRLATARNQLIQKDTALARKVAEYELLIAETSQAAEKQRLELQTVIEAQTTRIAELSGDVSQLVAEKNAVYLVVGTRKELIKKGILVPEGPRKFGVVGSRVSVPARTLDPASFTKLDRTVERAIILPHGGYKILSRQNTSFASKPTGKDGTYEGAIMIEEPTQFWSQSRFLIVVRS